MLFANYIDEKNDEQIRQNCLLISQETWGNYNDDAIAEILSLYSFYMIKALTTKKDIRTFL